MKPGRNELSNRWNGLLRERQVLALGEEIE